MLLKIAPLSHIFQNICTHSFNFCQKTYHVLYLLEICVNNLKCTKEEKGWLQKRRDVEQQGCRIYGVHDRRDSGQEGCRAGLMLESRDSE